MRAITTATSYVADQLFRDDRIAFLHARAVDFGCFTLWIDRLTPTAG